MDHIAGSQCYDGLEAANVHAGQDMGSGRSGQGWEFGQVIVILTSLA